MELLINAASLDALNAENKDGDTPLHVACCHCDDADIVKALLEKKINWKQNNNKFLSPFEVACQREKLSLDIIDALIAKDENCGSAYLRLTCSALTSKNPHFEDVVQKVIEMCGIKAFTDKCPKEKKNALMILLDKTNPDVKLIKVVESGWYLLDPGIKDVDGDIISNKVKKLLDSDTLEAQKEFENGFLMAVMNRNFVSSKCISILMIDLYVQMAVVASFSWGIERVMNHERNTFQIGVFIWALIWFLFRECVQIYTTPLSKYVVEESNYFDVLQIILIIQAAVTLNNESYSESDGKILILSIFVSWIQLLIMIGNFYPAVSIFVKTLLSIVVVIIPFFISTIFTVFMFAHMYHATSFNDDTCESEYITNMTNVGVIGLDDLGDRNWTCSLGDSYYRAFTMFLGFDWVFLEGRNGVLSDLSMCFAFLIGILLLNILIAAISDEYAEIQENSRVVFWANRVAYISEVEYMCAFLKNGVCKKKKKRESSTNSILNWWNKNDEKVPLLPGSLKEEDWLNKITRKEKEEFFDWWWDKKVNEINENDTNPVNPARLTFSTKKDKTKYARSKSSVEKATKTKPILRIRLRYFFNHADYKDIILPGPTFENIFAGITFRETEPMRPSQVIITRIASYTLLVFSVICLLIILIAGFVSFGHFWPKALCLKMFGGPTDITKKDKVADLQSAIQKAEAASKKKVANLEAEIHKMQANAEAAANKMETNMNKIQSNAEAAANKIEANMNDVKESVHKMTKDLLVNMEAAAMKNSVEAK